MKVFSFLEIAMVTVIKSMLIWIDMNPSLQVLLSRSQHRLRIQAVQCVLLFFIQINHIVFKIYVLWEHLCKFDHEGGRLSWKSCSCPGFFIFWYMSWNPEELVNVLKISSLLGANVLEYLFENYFYELRIWTGLLQIWKVFWNTDFLHLHQTHWTLVRLTFWKLKPLLGKF